MAKKYLVTIMEKREVVYEIEANSADDARRIFHEDGPDGDPVSDITHESEIDDISEST